MTTREEMALAFAKIGYQQVLVEQHKKDSSGQEFDHRHYEEQLSIALMEAVEMADDLIDELNKGTVPMDGRVMTAKEEEAAAKVGAEILDSLHAGKGLPAGTVEIPLKPATQFP